MLNPMMAMLNSGKLSNLAQMVAPIKQAMNMVQAASNPQVMIQQLLQNNPNYQKVTRLIAENGGDAQKAFYNLAGQMGVDPNEIINALK